MRVGANPTVAQAGDQYRQPTQVQVVGKSSVSAPDRLDLKIAAFLRRYGGLRSEDRRGGTRKDTSPNPYMVKTCEIKAVEM